MNKMTIIQKSIVALTASLALASACAAQTYKIGDSHPLGGIVASVDQSGTKGMAVDTKDAGMFNKEQALAASKERGGGWELPSIAALREVHKNLGSNAALNFKKDGPYLSRDMSSAGSYMWGINLVTGKEETGLHYSNKKHLVRFMRRFTPADPAPMTAGHINPGFELPQGKAGSFSLIKDIPGWKTTTGLFEIWSTGFNGVEAYEGKQFAELNADKAGILYQDSKGIKNGDFLEFTFAHRGRNGDDTMNLTITDLGNDGSPAGGDDTVLFTKEYTTGNSAWKVYDSTTEPTIKALGNTLRFAYSAVKVAKQSPTAPPNTEGNFLDLADLGVGVVSSKPVNPQNTHVTSPIAVVVAGNSKKGNEDGGEHIITEDKANQSGSLWTKDKIDFKKNFRISAEIYLGTNQDEGADGMALVFQGKSNQVVSEGGGIGYAGISPSFAVEFDTYQNRDEFNDPVQDHVGLRTDGDPKHTASDHVEVGELEDGNYHPITFEWNADKQNFSFSLDGKLLFKDQKFPSSEFTGEKVYFGFTAATGLYMNLHKVRSISFTN